jgi:hypothetical protein
MPPKPERKGGNQVTTGKISIVCQCGRLREVSLAHYNRDIIDGRRYSRCRKCCHDHFKVTSPVCECGEIDPEKFYPWNKSHCKKCLGRRVKEWRQNISES